MDEENRVTIDDFVIPQKVEAFAANYCVSTGAERAGAIVFDDARLRRFFAAYVVPGIGDPLIAYLDLLSRRGYQLSVTDDDELGIVVTRRLLPAATTQAVARPAEHDDDLY